MTDTAIRQQPVAKGTNIFAAKGVKWYRLGPVFSRNAVVNIILGPRGDGKTFAAKEQAIRNAINKNEQFIYLRRYKTELTAKMAFFDDVMYKFPDYVFSVSGNEARMKRPGEKKWETIGYFIALSNSQQKKSVPYPRVTLIIFDEFIIDRGAVHYLPNEVKSFLDFFSTVDRYQDKTRALLISNTVSVMNPYFVEWKIKDDGVEWWTDPSGFVCVHFIRDTEFSKAVRTTRLGQFIAGTEYGDYAIEAGFVDNTDALVRLKPATAKYLATIETKTGIFSVWYDRTPHEYYVQEKRPKAEVFWTMVPERMDEGKVYIPRNNKILQIMRTAYSRGKMFFDGPQARNSFAGVMV